LSILYSFGNLGQVRLKEELEDTKGVNQNPSIEEQRIQWPKEKEKNRQTTI
jgi:hypothetical protein